MGTHKFIGEAGRNTEYVGFSLADPCSSGSNASSLKRRRISFRSPSPGLLIIPSLQGFIKKSLACCLREMICIILRNQQCWGPRQLHAQASFDPHGSMHVRGRGGEVKATTFLNIVCASVRRLLRRVDNECYLGFNSFPERAS